MGGYHDFVIWTADFNVWVITPEYTAHGLTPAGAFSALVRKAFGEPTEPVQLLFS